MAAPGSVTAIDGEHAIVRMDETGCGRCLEPGGCGGNTMGKLFCSTPRTFRVLNPGRSVVGDRVSVVIAEGAVGRSAALAYGVPLLALLIGAASGSNVAGETGAIAGAAGGLLFAWVTLRVAGRRADQGAQASIKT